MNSRSASEAFPLKPETKDLSSSAVKVDLEKVLGNSDFFLKLRIAPWLWLLIKPKTLSRRSGPHYLKLHRKKKLYL